MNFRDEKIEYLDIKTVSSICKISYSALIKRCQRHKYQTRLVQSKGGKSGLKYEILFSSLEPELQYKIINNSKNLCIQGGTADKYCLHNKNTPVSLENFQIDTFIQRGTLGENNSLSIPVFLNNNDNFLKTIPQEAKNLALAKVDIISNWREFIKDKKDKNKANEEFICAYNSGLLFESLFKIVGKISKRSLYRWQKTLKDNNSNYFSLINGYQYSSEKTLNTSLTDFEKQEFIKLYFNDAQFNLSSAYNIMKYKFSQIGLNIKSITTFRRFVEYIKKNHNDFNVLARYGEKALKDNVAPYIKRDTSDFKVGDVLVADGNKLDFMIINPFTGKPARAVLVVFQDWASKDIAGFEIMLSENTQCISSALRNSIIRLGKIPKYVYMDNGRAFRGKYFTKVESFKQCGFQGIYQNLGIKTIFAKPYNGRAKIVERFFGDFVKTCPPAVSSYIGSSISKQPAHNKRNEKFHKELHKEDKIPTIKQAKIIIEEWLKFYRSSKHPHDKTKTVGEIFESGKGSGVDIELLDELMMSSVLRTARKNTIKLFNQEYTTAALYGKTGKFLVKYSLFDISKIKIYTQKGEYIGEASAIIPIKALAKEYGSACDYYTFKKQQKEQNMLIKNTIKKTKELLTTSKPFDDIPWSQAQDVIEIEPKRIKKKLEITCYENAHLFKQEKRKLTI